MKTKLKAAVIPSILLAALLLSSCIKSGGDDTASISPTPTAETEKLTAEETTKSKEELLHEELTGIISEMTLEEKVGQMFFVRCPDAGAVDAVNEYHLGGYVLFGRDFAGKTSKEIKQNIENYQSASKIPLLVGVDEEGGTVVRVSDNENLRDTPFLSPRDTYSAGGWDLIEAEAKEKAELLLSLGVNVNIAPVCDITDNEYSFIYDRSFSGDAELTSEFITRYVTVSRSAGIGTVLKHFPGYGDNTDTHEGMAYDDRAYSEFQSRDLLPFKAGIDSGADSVMVAHNVVSSVDPDYPASLSKKMHEILRTELGFDGVIMTDDLVMGAITSYTGDDASAVFAVKSGNDILCCTNFEDQYPAVLEAVKYGDIDEEQINDSVFRILRWKKNLGLI